MKVAINQTTSGSGFSLGAAGGVVTRGIAGLGRSGAGVSDLTGGIRAPSIRFAVALVFAALALCCSRPVLAQISQVELPRGATLPYMALAPSGKSKGAVVLLTGGLGRTGFAEGKMRSNNFLFRVRQEFRKAGYLVLIPDPPSDLPGGYTGTSRSSASHAADIALLIQQSRSLAHGPVWVVGTSRGTISAVNIASRVPGVSGVILTASVSRDDGRRRRVSGSVYSAGLSSVRAPTLIVHHAQDQCELTPASDVPAMLSAVGAQRKSAVYIDGGLPPRSDPCGPLSAHGFLGVEGKAVNAMLKFMSSR